MSPLQREQKRQLPANAKAGKLKPRRVFSGSIHRVYIGVDLRVTCKARAEKGVGVPRRVALVVCNGLCKIL